MNKVVLMMIFGVLVIFIVLVIWKQESSVVEEDKISSEVVNDGDIQLPPEKCVTWFDGCNTCKISEAGGPMACTLMACAEMQQPYCMEYEDGNSKKTLHPSWDVNGDGINDCEKEDICDHTIDYSQPRMEIDTVSKEVENGLNNATYKIGNETITLTDGKVETEIIPESATKIVTQTTKYKAEGDLQQGTGATLDGATVLVQNSGGSGTFYYIGAIAQQADKTYVAVNGTYLLGDRITIDSVKIDKRMIYVTYFDRKEGDLMTTEPTVKITKQFATNGINATDLVLMDVTQL